MGPPVPSEGGYQAKKNLLTSILGVPLYHMGGAATTYMLLNGSNLF